MDYQSDVANITVERYFNVLVNKCKILSYDYDVRREESTYYIYAQNDTFQYTTWTFDPPCVYDTEYTYQIEGDEEKLELEIFWDDLGREVMTGSREKLLHDQYFITTELIILDYNITYEPVVPTNTWILNVIDPCKTTVMVNSFDRQFMYTIIGNGGANYEFRNFNDTESERIDDEEDENRGFIACEKRQYNLTEIEFTDKITRQNTTNETLDIDLKYISVYPGSTDHNMQVFINSDRRNDAGTHLVQLNCSLELYPNITNSDAIFEVTFFEQTADLSIEDQEYELFQGDHIIAIGDPQFNPKLHNSVGPFGENGAEILTTLEVQLHKQSSFIEVPDALGAFDERAMQLIINCEETDYLGYNKFRVNYAGQDYLVNETFYEEFGVSVFPKV